jgi:hypothetical protein
MIEIYYLPTSDSSAERGLVSFASFLVRIGSSAGWGMRMGKAVDSSGLMGWVPTPTRLWVGRYGFLGSNAGRRGGGWIAVVGLSFCRAWCVAVLVVNVLVVVVLRSVLIVVVVVGVVGAVEWFCC